MSVPFPYGKSFVFSFAEFVGRLLGLLFLARFMDAFGLDAGGVFRTALPLIFLASAVGNVGLPTALTRWLAASGLPRQLRPDQLLSIVIATCCAVIITYASLVVILWSSFISVLGIQPVDDILRFSVPLLLLFCASGSLRGLMIGQGRNFAPAVAQAITALAQVLLVNPFTLALAKNMQWSGAKAGVAITTGAEAIGVAVLCGFFFMQNKDQLGRFQQFRHYSLNFWKTAGNQIRNLRLLTRLTAPPTIQTILESLGFGLELPMAEHMLSQHFGSGLAEQWMAWYAAVAIPLLHFPLFAADGLATALLPTLTAARAQVGRAALTQSLTQVLRFSLLLSIPSTGILYLFGPTLCKWLDAPEAAPILAVMAPLALIVYIQSPLTSLVQAHGHSRVLLIAEFVGDVCRLSGLWIGLQVMHMNIWGLVVAFACGVTSQTAVLWIAVWRLTPISIPWRTFSHGILATVQMCAFLLLGEHQEGRFGFHHEPIPWLIGAVCIGGLFLVIAEEIPAVAVKRALYNPGAFSHASSSESHTRTK